MEFNDDHCIANREQGFAIETERLILYPTANESMAGDGAILVTEDGTVSSKKPPKGTVVNSVGAGDSMVAGFLAGWLNTGDYEKALELGTAAGSATAFVSWLATREEITEKLERTEKEYGI